MVNKELIVAKLVEVLGNYANFIREKSAEKNNASWIEYAKYVSKQYDYFLKICTNINKNNIYGMTSTTSGLSRYFGEFEWDSDTEKGAQEYLNTLAELRVELLDAYDL